MFDFQLTMEDYTIILNALHYYKKVEKKGNFRQYDERKINKLRDKMAYQMIPSALAIDFSQILWYDMWDETENLCGVIYGFFERHHQRGGG